MINAVSTALTQALQSASLIQEGIASQSASLFETARPHLIDPPSFASHGLFRSLPTPAGMDSTGVIFLAGGLFLLGLIGTWDIWKSDHSRRSALLWLAKPDPELSAAGRRKRLSQMADMMARHWPRLIAGDRAKDRIRNALSELPRVDRCELQMELVYRMEEDTDPEIRKNAHAALRWIRMQVAWSPNLI